MSDRPDVAAAADVLLLKDGKVLLNLRAGASWGAGYYGIPGGHVDPGEDFAAAAIREMQEELGITIKREDLDLKHVMYRPPGSDGKRPMINLKFACERWEGEPRNREPDKSAGLRWVDPADPPENTLPHERQTLECYRQGVLASTFDGYATGAARLD